MITTVIIAGRLADNPELRQTTKGKPWARLLIEAKTHREVTQGNIQQETYILPISCFARAAEQAKGLQKGDAVMIAAHLTGTEFSPPGGEVKRGCQIIADFLAFPRP